MLATTPRSPLRRLQQSLMSPVSGLACSQKKRKHAFSRSSRNWPSSRERPTASADRARLNGHETLLPRICRNSFRRDNSDDLLVSASIVINLYDRVGRVHVRYHKLGHGTLNVWAIEVFNLDDERWSRPCAHYTVIGTAGS